MTPADSASLTHLVQNFFILWFTPDRSFEIMNEGPAIAHFLELDTDTDHESKDPENFFEKQLVLKRAAFKAAPRPKPTLLDKNLNQLCEQLSLSKPELQILRYLCLAEAYSELYTLCLLKKGISSRSAAAQIAECLQLPATTVYHLLSQSGKLLQSGLVHCCRHHPAGYIFSIVDSEIALHLIEDEFDLKKMISNLGSKGRSAHLALTDFSHIRSNLDIILPYLKESLKTRRRGVNIFIHGIPGTGKTELARLLGDTLQCGTFEPSFIDHDGDPISGPKRFSKLRCALTFFKNDPTLIVCDEAEDFFPEPRQRDDDGAHHKLWINRLLEENETPIIWLSNSVRHIDPATIRRFDLVFELPVPSQSQRRKLIEKSVGSLVSKSVMNTLAENENLAPSIISRAAAVLGTVQPHLPASSLDQAFPLLVSQTLKAQGHPTPCHVSAHSDLTYDPTNSCSSVDLRQLVVTLRNCGQARICLEGPPGTGKTAFGRWLAGSLELPFLSHRLSDLLSSFVGQTEKKIADAFETAAIERGVLMLDEIDSLLADRRQAQMNWEITQVSEMLTQMESFGGILVATTNRIASLDSASRRRFDLTISLDYLKAPQIEKLFRTTCETIRLKKVSHPSDLSSLPNATPGDFAALVRQHRFHPFSDSSALAQALTTLCAQKTEHTRDNAIGFIAT